MITNQTLKNAARAIEHDLWTDPDGANYLVKDGAILRRWEPEHSSADSFELITALWLDVGFFPGFAQVRVSDEQDEHVCWINYTDDRSVDTRLAVLHCASEIGESLCQ